VLAADHTSASSNLIAMRLIDRRIVLPNSMFSNESMKEEDDPWWVVDVDKRKWILRGH
jgi:GTP-dependent phosphoenolpyruvate carboxykinase